MKERKEERHESYGIVNISRVTGGYRNFFGTHLTPVNFFELRICRGRKLIDEFGEEKFYPDYSDERFIEIWLTPHQFSDMITTMNISEGTPCTISRLNGAKVDECPKQTVPVDSAINTVLERIGATKYEEGLRESAIEILKSEKNINKKDRAILLDAFLNLEKRLGDNSDFYKKQICEIGEKVKAEIRTEIDAQMTSVINKLGIRSLEQLRLEDGK